MRVRNFFLGPSVRLFVMGCLIACSISVDAAASDRIKVRTDGSVKAELILDASGAHHYEVDAGDGGIVKMNPQTFTDYVLRQETSRPWAYKLLNITSPWGLSWVILGLLGQVLFTGRMIVQWVVSEKNKKSTVPPIFWYMSLGGATMLLLYFGWRRDLVGVLGQSTGWFVYFRNIVLLQRHRVVADEPLEQPEALSATEAQPVADAAMAQHPVPAPA